MIDDDKATEEGAAYTVRGATENVFASLAVILDRWENSRAGKNIARFVERIGKVDRVITIGTPLYRKKHENKGTETGYGSLPRST